MGRVIWPVVLIFTAIWAGWLEFLVVRQAVDTWPVFKTDFTVFYTAARVPLDVVYDSAQLTAAQAWSGADGRHPRPFPYPPTFLFLLWPLGRLAVLPALVAWVTLGLGAFCLAARKLIGKAWPMILLSPAVLVGIISGQVVFLMGAGLMTGVIWLPKRPLLAGVAFGLAATIKPQVLVFVPFALVFAGQWRTLGAAVVAGTLLGLASLAVHQGMWLQWVAAVREFNELISHEAWPAKISATPVGFFKSLGVENGWVLGAIAAVSAVSALAMVYRAFRRDDPVARYAALTVGYLLVAPYALWYELALLQPVAVVCMLDRRWIHRGGGLLAFALFPRALGVLALASTSLLERPASREQSPKPVQGDSLPDGEAPRLVG